MKKLIMILTCILASVGLSVAQTTRVSGTVVDDTGETVIGASVVAKGSTVGTVTDIDGKFSLNIPSDRKTLVISLIGYQKKEVPAGTDIKVVLEQDSKLIDEVIVVAYGTAKKSSFTGAASSIGGDQLSKLQVSSISNALQGAAPGIQSISTSGQPGENASIRIRGVGSFSASSSPLYVVDGIPYNEVSVNSLNPADIESITVLKDAASASLYGSRAANGVIMITTKKGSATKSKVTLDARWGVNSRGVPDYDIMSNSGEYLKTYWSSLKTQEDAEYASKQLITDLGYNPYIGVANDKVITPDGVLTSAPLRYNDNWADETLVNGLRQEYNLSLQGGNDKSTHFLSFGYLSDEGILRNTDFQRFSTRLNITHKINKNIDLGANLSYARAEKNAGSHSDLSNYSNAFMFIRQVAPIYPVFAYDDNGSKLYDDNGDVIYDFGDGTYGARAGGFANQNSAATSNQNKNQHINDNVSARGYANIRFLNDFLFTANFGYDLMNGLRTRHMNPNFGDAKKVGGRTYKYNNRYQTITANQLLNYSKKIGDHAIDALAGHESYELIRNYQYTQKYGFYTNDNLEFNNAITMSDMTSYTHEHSMESWLGRLNYNYLDKYYLSASLRTDESSKFHPDNRRGTFWSIGGSWRIDQEAFMESVKAVSDLRFKVSYGTQGNDGILDYNENPVYQPYMKQYTITNNNGEPSVVETYRGNKDLTWEKSQNLNIGLEGGLFDNRVKFEFDFFQKKTTDMLYNMPYPTSSGISYIPMNLLNMKNVGFDANLKFAPVRNNDITWNLNLNFTHYKNTITKLPDSKRQDGIIHGPYGARSLYLMKEGGSVYDFFLVDYAGVDPDTGASLWYYNKTENGVVTREKTDDYDLASRSENKVNKGTSLPDLMGAISTDVTYKNFDFSISTNYQLGGQVLDLAYKQLMHAGSSPGTNWHKDILNFWTPENRNTDVPRLDAKQNTSATSSRFLIGASYFSIQNITLGYTLPSTLMQKLSVSNSRIYVAADNVALFSKRKGMDPRQYAHGIADDNYSAIRSISFGININF
ncbi:TonB-dependent receptor [Dysgonomonas sp. OttesenSCG-928-M03]|nr:TonB-dependent receptor [Dysgonomonas sp. OttesenSCG-928-M03]